MKIFCEPFIEGTHNTYYFSHDDQVSFQDVHVAQNKNNLMQVIMISKKELSTESYFQKTIYNYIKEANTIYLLDMTIESNLSLDMMIRNKYRKPHPICGEVPFQWVDSIHSESNIAGTHILVDLPPQAVSIRFLSKEKVHVPAGIFETSVFEKSARWVDENSSVTQTTISYLSEKVGVVKQVVIRVHKDRFIEVAKSEEMDKLMEKGLADLQQGKKISEIDFFKDSTNVSGKETSKLKVTKSISIRELFSHNK